MQPGIELDRRSKTPLQAQLVARLRELILNGQFSPNKKLPASRELSAQLGISRNTVLLSYDRLIAEGYLEVRGKAGTYVTGVLPERLLNIELKRRSNINVRSAQSARRPLSRRVAAPILHERPKERVRFDFRIGRPDPRSFPIKIWRRILLEKLTNAGRSLTEYGNPAGLLELRTALVAHLRTARGIEADADQVIIVGGCEEGLNIVARMLTPPGTNVFVETPCYRGVSFVFESFEANVIPIPVDREGICVSTLPDAGASLACVTPSHQFPTGVTMSLNRRLQLLEWARRNGAYIVEDDYDSDFRYSGSPLMALSALDRDDCVIYLGTFSKSLGGGLRIGYLVVPPELIGPAREMKALINLGNPWLEQAVLAEFISSGSFEQHLRRVRKTYLQRRDVLINSLHQHFGQVEISGEEGGMHLMWLLNNVSESARVIQNDALHHDVGIYTIDDGPALDYEKYVHRNEAIFLGYPCLTSEEIETAVRRLSQVINHEPSSIR